MHYRSECWETKKQHIQKASIDTLRDQIVNERGKSKVAAVVDKMRETRIKRFGHVQRKPIDAIVR